MSIDLLSEKKYAEKPADAGFLRFELDASAEVRCAIGIYYFT